MKFKASPAQAQALSEIQPAFVNFPDSDLIAKGFGLLLGAVAGGDCDSISISVYRSEMQISFWKKNGSSSKVLANITFTTPEKFIEEMEDLE